MRKKFIVAAMAALLPLAACENKSAQRIRQAELCMRERAHLGPDVKIEIDGELDAPRVTLSSPSGLERLPSIKPEWNDSRFNATKRIYSFDQQGNFMADRIFSQALWDPALGQGNAIFYCLKKNDFVKSNNVPELSGGPSG